MARLLPKYPIYIPTKGRAENSLTARFLLEDQIPFFLVVEEAELEAYRERFGGEELATILVLPESGRGVSWARNWLKDHSVGLGAERHWQLDDNIRRIRRYFRGRRIPCAAGPALHITESFVDRYENVAVAGLNYAMFGYVAGKLKPFRLNVHVYSCTLVLNAIPFRWRLAYNEDTDLCLQVLAGGWCTVLMNLFLAEKMRTMTMGGGNTDDDDSPVSYQGDGRLEMANALKRAWPGVVQTKRRFRRPQHVIRDNWMRFDTPLKRKPGLEISAGVDEFGMKLIQIAEEVKSPELRGLLDEMG